jgi:hypothetical protein
MTSALESHVHDGLSFESHERRLRARVAGEFREMPGLTLTLAQASRLFSLEADRCERVLGALVQHGVLVRRGQVWRVDR